VKEFVVFIKLAGKAERKRYKRSFVFFSFPLRYEQVYGPERLAGLGGDTVVERELE